MRKVQVEDSEVTVLINEGNHFTTDINTITGQDVLYQLVLTRRANIAFGGRITRN